MVLEMFVRMATRGPIREREFTRELSLSVGRRGVVLKRVRSQWSVDGGRCRIGRKDCYSRYD